MNIIFLGAPGSGKDTLADQLEEHFNNYQILTPGAIYRSEADKKTELGIWARDTFWGKGMLCPDDLTNKIVCSAYEEANLDKDNITIFNGYPRTRKQASFMLDNMGIDLVLCLDVDEEIAVKRLISRGREDDTQDVIIERFRVFSSNENSIKEFCLDCDIPMVSIDANATIERVFHMAKQNISYFSRS